MAKLEGIKVALASEVQVAVGKAEVFSHFVRRIIKREGRCLRLVMDNNVACKQFDITGIEVGIFSAFVTVADFSANFNDTLGFELGEKFGKSPVLRIKYYLCLALPVA